jgi:transketolase
VWTHDSVGLGEDGPTHQPIEHVWSLRNIIGLDVVRPADANETAVAWRTVIERTDHPAGLCLTRQNVPVLDREKYASAEGAARGAYVLAEASGGAAPDVILIGTGSEVQIAVHARELLEAEGISARVVSMPCLEWFHEQDASYQEEVLPAAVRARVSVEAGITPPWKEIVGDAGESVGVDRYGASASQARIYEEFGLTAERVAEAAKSSLSKVRR